MESPFVHVEEFPLDFQAADIPLAAFVAANMESEEVMEAMPPRGANLPGEGKPSPAHLIARGSLGDQMA